MKSLRRFILPLFVLAALALSVAGVAFAREGTVSNILGVRDQEVEFTGVVQAMNGNTWTVDGRTFVVDISTEIKDTIAVGQTVKVHARMAADGSLTAREIELADLPGIEDANENTDDDLLEENVNDEGQLMNDNANENQDEESINNNANANSNDNHEAIGESSNDNTSFNNNNANDNVRIEDNRNINSTGHDREFNANNNSQGEDGHHDGATHNSGSGDHSGGGGDDQGGDSGDD